MAGLAGFALNQLPLSLAGGIAMTFGAIPAFVLLRVLSPQQFTLAVSIASLATIVKLGHPWGWAIATVEALVLGFSPRNSPPARNDILFWVMIGSPLIAITCGGLLEQDSVSVLLAIMEQSMNGVFNVVLAELGYAMILRRINWPLVRTLPHMSLAALIHAALLAVCLVPATVYFHIYAPNLEQQAVARAHHGLRQSLSAAETILGQWCAARLHEAGQFSATLTANTLDGGEPLPRILKRHLVGLAVYSSSGERIAVWGATVPRLQAAEIASRSRASRFRLLALPGQNRWALVMPLQSDGRPRWILAELKPDALDKAISRSFPGIAFSFVSEDGEALYRPLATDKDELANALNAARIPARDEIRQIFPAAPNATPRIAADTATMFVASRSVDRLGGWRLVAGQSAREAIMSARNLQVRFLVPVALVILGLTVIGEFMALRLRTIVREIGEAVASAVKGSGTAGLERLVVAELAEIARRITNTERLAKRERRSLMRTQRWMESLSRNAPVVLYVISVHDGQKADVIFVSDTAKHMLGYETEEIMQRDWWLKSIHPDDFAGVISSYRYLQEGDTITNEYRLWHKEGHYVWVFDSMTVEKDADTGKWEGIGLTLDITDRRLAGEQLLQAAKMGSLGRMAAGIAHELNQPLNFIKLASLNLAERIRQDRFEAGAAQEKLQLIVGQIERAATIVSQIRTFGRRSTEPASPVALASVVENVTALLAPQLRSDGIAIDISHGHDATVFVRAQVVPLEQVLLNLVLNAADAIATRRLQEPALQGRIDVSVVRRKDKAILTVTDNGTGLAPETAAMLFEPFFTTKGPQEGTGLGLSVSYGIVTDLGGTIRADNVKEGARFSVTLPLVARKETLAESVIAG